MDIINNIRLERIGDGFNFYIPKVQSTYTASFPETERRDFSLFCSLVKEEPDFTLCVILKDSRYAGFITYWDFRSFVYIEHFAIDRASRCGGIGSAIMKQFLELVNRNVVLEVESVVDEQTRRRVNFYEALGFVLHKHDYKQPPYRDMDPWADMKLMTYGGFDMDNQYETLKEILYSKVYNQKKAD